MLVKFRLYLLSTITIYLKYYANIRVIHIIQITKNLRKLG